jgi:hypothetical protein
LDSAKYRFSPPFCYTLRMMLRRTRDRLLHEVMVLRRFFTRNVTGYTYLFFAQTSFIAENIFWRYQLKGPLGKTPLHSIIGKFVLLEILFYYSFPLFFVIAAFLTFNYPKEKTDRFTFLAITVVLSLFVLAAAWLS